MTRSWFSSSVTTRREWPVETQRLSAASTVSDKVDGDHGRDRGHDLARLLLVEVKDAREHAGFADVDLAARGGLGDQALELVRRPALGLGVGVGTEHSQDRFGRRVQHEDERAEQNAEELHRPGDPPGQALRVLDRVELGDDLADDAQGDRDQQVGDHHRHRNRGGVPDRAPQDRLEHVRDRGLAERADADRGHRDPDLTGRDVIADVVYLSERQASTTRPLLGQRLQPRPARTDQRILRDHEEGIDQDQQPGEDDEKGLHRLGATRPPPRRPAGSSLNRPAPWSFLAGQPLVCELLLRDGSSSFMQRQANGSSRPGPYEWGFYPV